jgi:5,10-methylenetetrahydromethanopterin reductase
MRWPTKAAYEFGGDVTVLPGTGLAGRGEPQRERHLAVHNQHLVALNDADQAAGAAGS